MASPAGCADADTEVIVDSERGKALVDGSFAEASTAPEKPKVKPKAESAPIVVEITEADLKAALDQLDATNADHWNGNGKPDLATLRDLTGSTSLSRTDVDGLAPDFRHPMWEEAVINSMGLITQDDADGIKSDEESETESSEPENVASEQVAEIDKSAETETAAETDGGEKTAEPAAEAATESKTEEPTAATKAYEKPKRTRKPRTSAP